MRTLLKKIITAYYTKKCLKKIKHGKNCKVNYNCKFSENTIIGNNCHFNGINISGNGKVSIGNNFHSGKNIRILTTFHNYDEGSAIPYDDTVYSKNIMIEDNVWLGENVMILGGVTIGEGAVIQAGSVVCRNVPALAIAGGHPAEPFKYRNKEHYFNLKEEKRFM